MEVPYSLNIWLGMRQHLPGPVQHVMQDIGPRLGIMVVPMPVSDQAAIESAIGRLAREPNSALVALPDVFMTTYSQLTFALAVQARLPTVGASLVCR